jgi:hypothetical protein
MLLHRVVGLKGMLEGQYGKVDVDQRFTRRSRLSALGAEALRLPEDTEHILNDKIYSVHGVMVVRFVQEVPLDYVSTTEAQALIENRIPAPSSIFEWSGSWPGREIDHSVVELVPRVAVADPEDVAAGVVDAGKAYIEMRDTHYSERNEPVAYGREAVNDEFMRMRLVRTH